MDDSMDDSEAEAAARVEDIRLMREALAAARAEVDQCQISPAYLAATHGRKMSRQLVDNRAWCCEAACCEVVVPASVSSEVTHHALQVATAGAPADSPAHTSGLQTVCHPEIINFRFAGWTPQARTTSPMWVS